jgi:Flp pilus assembly protein CpaB
VKRSNRLVILVGVLLAVLAFVGIVILLNTQGEQAPPPEELTVEVLVADRDLEIGEVVTADDVTLTEVEAADVVGRAIGDESAIPARPLIYPIATGGQVPQDAFGGVGGAICIECQLEPGEKAIAFEVDRVTGLDFLIQPGDHVDIVLAQTVQVLQPTVDTADSPQDEQRFETIPGLENAKTVKTILQDRRVLFVSARNVAVQPQATPAPGEEEAPAPQQPNVESVIIVIAGSAQDAEVIKFAQNQLGNLGPLTAILRRTLDTAEEVPNEETTGITIDILFEEYGIPIPDLIIDLGPEAGGGGGGGGQ